MFEQSPCTLSFQSGVGLGEPVQTHSGTQEVVREGAETLLGCTGLGEDQLRKQQGKWRCVRVNV